jgi:hypothetical protein
MKKGDRVRITNRIRRPAVWPSTTARDDEIKERERRAAVTGFAKGHVHITTNNGTKTSRAPSNVQKIAF